MTKIEKEELKTTIFLINGWIKLLEYMINYYKFANPDLSPPFTNKEGAEALLQKYFCSANNNIFKYLNTTKRIFLEENVNPRVERITYLSYTNITDKKV